MIEATRKSEPLSLRHRPREKDRLTAPDGALEMMKRIKATQANFLKIETLTEDGTDVGSVELPVDPGGSVVNSGFDPTPEISLLEVAALQTELSYQDLITAWYTVVEDLETTQPGVFTGSDPSAYATALELKLLSIGFSASEAQKLTEFIVDKIQN